MKKAEIIKKIQEIGEWHNDMVSYSKSELEAYYNDCMKARTMSAAELEDYLKSQGLL